MIKARGAAKVREVIADEHRAMQTRAYKRIRPYLAAAMSRLRRATPAFQTVVFCAKDARFSLVFGDGTQPHEAPTAFAGLKEACEELARFPEIDWLTAADPLWQVLQGTPQPEQVIEQYRYIESKDWCPWAASTLRNARYYMRQDIYFRTVYGSHRSGYGKRIVDKDGTTIDEWVDPVMPLILRVLRERGAPISLDPLCDILAALAGFKCGSFYYWDVLHACEDLRQRGALRRVNPKASEIDARYVLARVETGPRA